MEATTRSVLTIVAEAAIERLLLTEFRRLAVPGYTIVEARGAGEHGRRDGDWDASRNLRIEIVCDEVTAHRTAKALLERFGKNHSLILWLQTADVYRTEKFDRGRSPREP